MGRSVYGEGSISCPEHLLPRFRKLVVAIPGLDVDSEDVTAQRGQGYSPRFYSMTVRADNADPKAVQRLEEQLRRFNTSGCTYSLSSRFKYR